MSGNEPAQPAPTPGAPRRVMLREIAHARAGDKGNISSVSVFPYDPAHYPALKAQLTPARLREAFGNLLRGEIQRYELDTLPALNFVMHEALEGGVNSSLNLDAHGKSFSFLVLSLEVEV